MQGSLSLLSSRMSQNLLDFSAYIFILVSKYFLFLMGMKTKDWRNGEMREGK